MALRARGGGGRVSLGCAGGEADVDVGEATIRLDGQERKVALFVMTLPYSGAIFLQTFSRECTETFLEGHRRAFEFFEGVPHRIGYDNSAIAVIEVIKGRERKLTREFLRLQSHYLFREHFCLVRRLNEKGNVEGLIGFARRNFLVPVPEVGSLEELNAQLRERCLADLAEPVCGRSSSKQDRLPEDQAAFLPIPKQPFDARRVGERTVDSQSLVRFDDNEYSVPIRYAHRRLLVIATVQEVRLVYEERLVARHLRCWDRERKFFEPIHYLALLERKPGGLDYARPLEQWGLPEFFSVLRRRLEAGDPRSGTRSNMRKLIERERKAAERRLKAARFPAAKLLEEFDLAARPSVNKPLVLLLAKGEYLDRRENILLAGSFGIGKAYLATVLGMAACARGCKVRFFRVTELITQLLKAKEERQLLRVRQSLAKLDLLILDELGYVPASKAGAELLFDVIGTAHERNSLLVTTNLPFENWTEVLGSERLTGAALDRRTHRCRILETQGGSYRLQDATRRRRSG